MRLRCLLPLALLLLLPAASANGDGFPPVDLAAGPDGVLGPNGGFRFGALPTPGGTVLTKTTTQGGQVLRAEVLEGSWGVPVVTNDGTSGGLSADGSTLVLVRTASRQPRRHTSFAVVSTKRFATEQAIELKGKWNFDALSPDASTVYLIQTTDARHLRYAVRAYDLRAGRLLPDPIVDPSEPGEPMRGSPMARTTSRGGRWVYTLYTGGDHPFVHALDTVRRTSLCLDLPHRAARHAWGTRLAIRGDRIQVLYRDRVIASATRRPQEASTGGGPPWAVAILLASGLIAAVGVRRVTVSRSAHPRR
jgi:hypothetical protein